MEGRLDAEEIEPGSGCYRIRRADPNTLTYFHARLGYRVSESAVKRRFTDAERFWELNPIIYETGWIQDAPRHTCLDFYFYATNKNAGATAGYTGNLDYTFYKHYKSKLRTDNIPAAVARFYRLMPKPYLHLETAKDPVTGDYILKLPPWYIIKDDPELAATIEQLATTLADLSLNDYKDNHQFIARGKNNFKLIEHSWRLYYTGADGMKREKVFYNRQELVVEARRWKVIGENQFISFPIDGQDGFQNGRIAVNSWRVDGTVFKEGKNVWLRPVRHNKDEALALLERFKLEYTQK